MTLTPEEVEDMLKRLIPEDENIFVESFSDGTVRAIQVAPSGRPGEKVLMHLAQGTILRILLEVGIFDADHKDYSPAVLEANGKHLFGAFWLANLVRTYVA